MTRFAPQWLQAGTYSASIDRRLIGALWPAPASAGCAVTAGTGMTVNVAAGQVAVPTANTTGTVLCTSDAVETVTIAASAAQDRIDLVVCQPRSTDVGSGTGDDFWFTSVAGTPAASPVPPATPAGTVVLAQVRVPTGSASIVAGNITDVRPFGLAIAETSALPPPVTTGSTVQSFTDGAGTVWVAKNGVNAGNWRRARDVVASRAYRAAAFNITNTPTLLAFDTIERDPYGLYTVGTGLFTCPVPGLYRSTMHEAFTAVAATGYDVRLQRNGAVAYIAGGITTGTAPGASGRLLGAADLIFCAAGDLLGWQIFAPNTTTGAPGQTVTWASFAYHGTG